MDIEKLKKEIEQRKQMWQQDLRIINDISLIKYISVKIESYDIVLNIIKRLGLVSQSRSLIIRSRKIRMVIIHSYRSKNKVSVVIVISLLL